MVAYVKTCAKAFAAALLAFLTGLSTALSANSSFGDITDQQWVFIGTGTVVAFLAVWGVNNTPLAK